MNPQGRSRSDSVKTDFPFRVLCWVFFIALAASAFGDADVPPPLPIGASAPDFLSSGRRRPDALSEGLCGEQGPGPRGANLAKRNCLISRPSIECNGHRAFEVVTVSINYPDERPGVLSVLNRLHATSRNLLLGSSDIYPLLAAFDADWNAAVPYTILLKPRGEVVFRQQGTINPS